MKLTTSWKLNLDNDEIKAKMNIAGKRALTLIAGDITEDAKDNSPYLTGNNRRGIDMEVGPGGAVARKNGQAAVFSTSGYGGYLEIDEKHPPYFKPACDKHIGNLAKQLAVELER